MENHHNPNTPIILKVHINCCNKCPNILETQLYKIHGVDTVTAYQELNLAVVTGNVDPKMLIDTIHSKGKEATIGTVEDLKRCMNKNIHSDDDHCAEDSDHGVAARNGRCQPEQYNSVGGSRREREGKKCYCKGDPNYKKKSRGGDRGDHVVENFEAPKFEEVDEKICRDQFCRIHRRKNSGVPPLHDGPPMYWNHQPLGGLGRGYFPAGRIPQPPLPQYGSYGPSPYGYRPSSMPPPSRSMRPPFGNGYCGGDYDVPNRGCGTM